MNIWETLGKVFGFAENATKPEQYTIKRFKRFAYRIEAAMRYVFVDEKAGRYKDITDEDQVKLKLHYRKRIFDSN